LTSGQGPRSGKARQNQKGDDECFRGTSIRRPLRRWKLVLFPTCCSNAASTGQADSLIAAHKWFNLAALKGRTDAIPLRREVAEMMSEIEIAMAQREARAWMTAR